MNELLLFNHFRSIQSGELVSDVGPNGEITGSLLELVDGKFDQALRFPDSAGDYVEFKDLVINRKFSVGFWYKPGYNFPLDGESTKHIITNIPLYGATLFFTIDSEYINPDESIIITFYNATPTVSEISYNFGAGVVFTEGVWYHIGITVDADASAGEKIRLFINNEIKSPTIQSVSGSDSYTNLSFRVGGWATNGADGDIFDLRVVNFVLSNFLSEFNLDADRMYSVLYNWINQVVNTEQGRAYPIIQSRQESPAPAMEGLYLTISDSPTYTKIGRRSSPADTTILGAQEFVDDYEIMIEIWETNGSGESLRLLVDSIERQDIKDFFKQGWMTCIPISEIQYVPRIAENNWTKECLIEMIFRTAFYSTGDPGYIQTAEYTGTIPAQGRSGEHIMEN